MRALQVDAELSPLVRRKFTLTTTETTLSQFDANSNPQDELGTNNTLNDGRNTILRTEYSATTNRMLRVAVNGFMESLGVVLQVMEELDVDVLEPMS